MKITGIIFCFTPKTLRAIYQPYRGVRLSLRSYLGRLLFFIELSGVVDGG